MTVFIIVTLLLVVAALFFVIPPLQRHRSDRSAQSARSALNVSVYRDQLAELDRDLANDVITEEQHRQGRLELEQRLLEDVPGDNPAGETETTGSARGGRTAAIVFGVAVPLFAAVMYVLLGAPQVMTPQSATMGDVQGGMQDQIYRMVAQLEERLKNDPNDAEGWTMLGRSYLVLEQFDKALPALEHAVSLSDGDAQLLADYADALAMTSGQTLEGRPSELIERALAIDPNNQKALWLAGTAAYERSEYPLAIKYWTRLKDMAPPDSEVARAMDGNIAEARTLPERCTFTSTRLEYSTSDKAVIRFYNKDEFNDIFISMLKDLEYPEAEKQYFELMDIDDFKSYFDSLEDKHPILYKNHQGKTNEEIIDILKWRDGFILNGNETLFEGDELNSEDFKEFIKGRDIKKYDKETNIEIKEDTDTSKPRSVKTIVIQSSKLSKLPDSSHL